MLSDFFKKGFYSKILVVIIIALNIWFAKTVFGICTLGNNVPDSLIYAWFAFTTGELAILFGVKKNKLKRSAKQYEHDILDEETDQP